MGNTVMWVVSVTAVILVMRRCWNGPGPTMVSQSPTLAAVKFAGGVPPVRVMLPLARVVVTLKKLYVPETAPNFRGSETGT
jgi:hypothetical protein